MLNDNNNVSDRHLIRKHKTYAISLFRAQPHRRRLLAAHHQVDVVLRAQAMRYRREEAVGIRREVDASESRLEVEHRADKRRVLVREAVVLLTSPRRRFDVVKRAYILTPSRFVCLCKWFVSSQ